MLRFSPLVTVSLFCMAGVAPSQDRKTDAEKVDGKKLPRIAINDPAKLKDDTDFLLQGEYQGSMKTGDRENKLSIQLIARGNGNFEVVSFKDGLPGDGWDGKQKETGATVARKDGKWVVSNLKGEVGDLKDQVITLDNGKYRSEAKHIERKSPTLGAKPPKGAIVLFSEPDDIARWEMTKVVELSDGKFLGVGGRTKQKFQSFSLHLEFRLPWMPNSTGQARGNSGMYLQDRYEVQVLDSFGLMGEDNECGGIYQEAKPLVNMCFPPMVWQTYDIVFTAADFENGKKTKNAVVTVKHNGVIIHDKLELKNVTPGGGTTKETPEPGSLYLQNHGDPVVYRNIWIVEKK